MPVPRPPPHLPRPPARPAPGTGGEGPDPGCGRLRQGGSGLSRDGVSGAEGRRGAVATSSRTASGSCPPIHPQPAGPAAPAPRVAPPLLGSAPLLPPLPRHHREGRGAQRATARPPRAPPGGAEAAGGGPADPELGQGISFRVSGRESIGSRCLVLRTVREELKGPGLSLSWTMVQLGDLGRVP